MVKRSDAPGSKPDPVSLDLKWRSDLVLMLGALVFGPIIGMAVEALLLLRAPGPVGAATVLWLGQVLVVWRYWRRPVRPSLLNIDGTPLFIIRFYIIAHILALILPGLAVLLVMVR